MAGLTRISVAGIHTANVVPILLLLNIKKQVELVPLLCQLIEAWLGLAWLGLAWLGGETDLKAQALGAIEKVVTATASPGATINIHRLERAREDSLAC